MKVDRPLLSQILVLSVSARALLLSTGTIHKHSDLFLKANSSSYTVVMQQSDTTNIIAPGATLQLVSSQFSFTEGPASNKKGDIYFTDQPNDKIWKYDTDGQLSVFLEKSGRSNGMYFDTQGNLISCADEKKRIVVN